MNEQERKELALEAIRQMIKLLPPEEHGEDHDCEVLQIMIMRLGGLKVSDLKNL